MKQRKMRSINALVGALAEAESKLYNEDSTDLKGLCTLLKDFLKRDDPQSASGCGGSSRQGFR